MNRKPKTRGLILLAMLVLSAATSRADDGWATRLELEVGLGHDSNVAIDDVDLNTSRGENYRDLGVAGEVRYQPAGPWELGASLSVADKRYEDLGEFDGRLSLLSLSADREIGAFTLGTSLRYIDYHLDGDAFLEMVQVSPTLSWFPSRNLYLRLGYERSHERFPEAPGRDTEQDMVSGNLYFFMNGLRHYWMFRLAGTADAADSDLFTHEGREARLVYHVNFPVFERDTSLELSYRYQNRRYDEVINPAVGAHREDRRGRIQMRWELPVSDRLDLELRAQKANYRSNLAAADYRQTLYQLTLTYALLR